MTNILNNCITKALLLSCAFYVQPLFALTFQITPSTQMVGEVKHVVAKKGDTLYSIGRPNDIGGLEMEHANPKLNPEKNIKEGTVVVVPAQFILPTGERNGIVINIAELRVYYFPPNNPNIVMTFPLGLGKQGWHTPIGETKVVLKRPHPSWTPPDDIRAEDEARGIELPDVWPPGPSNPLGEYAMNFAWNGIRMHGTNTPTSIGFRSSHGCIRLFPEDIDMLFHNVDIGTKVRVLYQPYKMAMVNGKLYFEAHELFTDDYYNAKHEDKSAQFRDVLNTLNFPEAKINWFEVKRLISENNGYPVDISGPVPIVPASKVVAPLNKVNEASTTKP